ncbi:MAG: maltotransferase domain-containing protein [Chloroflexota bacterium]
MAPNKRNDGRANGGKPARAKAAVAAGAKGSAATKVPPVEPVMEQELPFLKRVVIESVRPDVDEGRFPGKATLGQRVLVEADIYADGHDMIAADLLVRREDETGWTRIEMEELVNDRWRAYFPAARMVDHYLTIEARIDHFGSWRRDLTKRVAAGQDVSLDLLVGAKLIHDALPFAPAKDAEALRNTAAELSAKTALKRRVEVALEADVAARMRNAVDKRLATVYGREARVQVDPPKAGFSAWYEMFPRSASTELTRPGTLRDVENRLSYVADMGFDVLYLPPIHPIGKTKRKGANNSVTAKAGDPGSPWAIGSELGGHKSIDPSLGTLDDFRSLVRKARGHGIDIALDIAFQCSPDHPYVREHPEWFLMRPDGSVQYAENPPKKYEDIYPFNFETPAWESLWQELLSVFLYWIEQGVTVFRVDNPHTKPFRFWEWLIAQVRAVDPGVTFLAEAFTRPKVMYHLAKLGFTQGYTYFAWRPDKFGLTEYFTELTQTEVADYFRPNAWPNTPDILTEQMQQGGRATFVSRLVLAATLSSNYGIYGPPFELMESAPREPGSEEYLHSEKYEQRRWDIERRDSLRELIALVNRARRDNPALHSNSGLRFHDINNDRLIAYSKQSEDGANVIICIVNLDSANSQSGFVSLPIGDWGLGSEEPYQVHDLLSDARYTWQGASNFVQLNPTVIPAHIFRLRRRVGTSGWEFA